MARVARVRAGFETMWDVGGRVAGRSASQESRSAMGRRLPDAQIQVDHHRTQGWGGHLPSPASSRPHYPYRPRRHFTCCLGGLPSHLCSHSRVLVQVADVVPLASSRPLENIWTAGTSSSGMISPNFALRCVLRCHSSRAGLGRHPVRSGCAPPVPNLSHADSAGSQPT